MGTFIAITWWIVSRGSLALLLLLLLRTLWIGAARRLGLMHPDHFRFWLPLPWRPVMRLLVRLLGWFEQSFFMGRRATARWAGFLERASLLYKPGSVLYGRQHYSGIGLYQPIGEDFDRHIVMIAGTGSGKTTQLVTMLSLHPGNVFAIDPKAQLFRVLRNRLADGGDGVLPKPPINGCKRQLAALNPQHLHGLPTQSWNAIDEIGHAIDRHGEAAAVRYAMRMADGLIKSGDRGNEFFPSNARGLCYVLLLFVYVTEPPHRRHMVRFRELLTQGLPPVDPIQEPFDMLLYEMQRCKAFGGVISQAAATIMGSSDRARGDILATARDQTKWLGISEVAAISTRSDFQLADLKTGALSLLLCAPATDLRTSLAPWARLLVMTTLYVFENIPGRLEHPCCVAIDELPSLGYVEGLDTIAPLMRDYSVRLVCISQGTEDLASTYPETWRKFLGNADAVFWLGIGANDTKSPEELGRILGTATRKEKLGGARPSDKRARFQRIERPLVYHEQIPRLLSGNNIIVTRYDQHHLRLRGARYYQELPVTHYTPDPSHRETLGRAWTRRLMQDLLCKHVDDATAMEMFGLRDGYTPGDVESRYQMLAAARASNREFARLARRARVRLLRKAVV